GQPGSHGDRHQRAGTVAATAWSRTTAGPSPAGFSGQPGSRAARVLVLPSRWQRTNGRRHLLGRRSISSPKTDRTSCPTHAGIGLVNRPNSVPVYLAQVQSTEPITGQLIFAPYGR